MKNLRILSLVLLIGFSYEAFASKQLKKVKLKFVEALSVTDTTSSKRFKEEYEKAIKLGKDLTREKLAQCGYSLDVKPDFYDASDPLQAKERAEAGEGENVWLMVGPRRSNHYLLMAKGAQKTPTVSLMASADEVFELGSLHLSLSPSNGDLAKTASKLVKKRIEKKTPSYYSIVSATCLSCKNFSQHFDRQAKKQGLQKLGEGSITGETPEVKHIEADLKRLNPSVVFLPNYSKQSAYIIEKLQTKTTALFIGGDGWGTSKFGFVQSAANLSASGFNVHGFPPLKEGLDGFALGKRVLAGLKDDSLSSSSALGILQSFESTVKLLCDERPKNLKDFRAAFKKRGKKLFSAPFGVTTYDLKNGRMSFGGSRKSL